MANDLFGGLGNIGGLLGGLAKSVVPKDKVRRGAEDPALSGPNGKHADPGPGPGGPRFL
jgi:hypothetical protein